MDLNDDGNLDILSGSYSRMGGSMAGLFQVLWGQSDATFQTAEALTGTDSEPLIIPAGDDAEQYGGTSLENICTRPIAIDWDADGDLDLVVGNFGGSFYVFLGEGKGAFQPVPQIILSDGKPLKIAGHHSDPFVIDWDNDGDLDLLSGSSQGGVQWAENTASAGQLPELMPFKALVPSCAQIEHGQLLAESDLEGPTSSTRIWVDDVNSDGKLDVLVGDSVTLISPAPGISVTEYEEKLADWQAKLQKASEKLAELREADEAGETLVEESESQESETESSGLGSWLLSAVGLETESPEEQQLSELEKAQELIGTLYEQRSDFMDSQATGFVWLYQQK